MVKSTFLLVELGNVIKNLEVKITQYVFKIKMPGTPQQLEEKVRGKVSHGRKVSQQPSKGKIR